MDKTLDVLESSELSNLGDILTSRVSCSERALHLLATHLDRKWRASFNERKGKQDESVPNSDSTPSTRKKKKIETDETCRRRTAARRRPHTRNISQPSLTAANPMDWEMIVDGRRVSAQEYDLLYPEEFYPQSSNWECRLSSKQWTKFGFLSGDLLKVIALRVKAPGVIVPSQIPARTVGVLVLFELKLRGARGVGRRHMQRQTS
ncbi:hypothetical protein C8F01DRAFT_1091174 [Mycena amicta]|nr:hypothetical protein C8F01DRAFT_1091174 [Mycena amicta]